MPDIATMSAFIGSIKTATELAKAIKGADLSLEKAETKLKIAELMSALADAKILAAEIQGLLQQKDKEIKGLKSELEFKPKLIRKDGCYFDTNELDKNLYEPFCSQCWEVKKVPVHLSKQSSVLLTGGGKPRRLLSYYCPTCKNPYQIIQGLS